MTKNPKKPTNLSMGGVVHRRPRVNDVQKPSRSADISKNAENSTTKTRLKTLKTSLSQKKPTRKSDKSKIKSKVLQLLLAAVLIVLYLFKVKTLPPTGNEGSLSITHNNLGDIDSIDFLPIKLVAIFFDKVGISSPLDIRLFSVFILLVSLFFFYKLTSSWFDRRIAAVAVLLYGSSTWMLASTRHDSEYIMLAVFLPVLLFCGAQLINTDSRIIRMLCAFILVQFIFVPGGLWFILASIIAIVLRKDGKIRIKQLTLPLVTTLIVLIGYVGLLFHLSLTGLSQILKIAGLQIGELPSLGTIKANIIELSDQLFINGLNDGSFWLHLTPVLDWISTIFLLVGVAYLITFKRSSFRAKYLLVASLLSATLIFLNGPFYVSLLLPLIYIVIVTGIGYLSREWLQTFPNNPLARTFGIALIGVVITMACVYHAERYFIGWPKTEEYRLIHKV